MFKKIIILIGILGFGSVAFGVFGDTFIPIQIGTNPDAGDMLVTDGTDSTWETPASQGLGENDWQFAFDNAITPTTTATGIYVTASSTIDSTLRVTSDLFVGGNATTSGNFDAGGYCFNGANCFAGRPSPDLYDAIVAADGTGEYLLLSDAIDAGETGIFIRNGTYVETGDIDINTTDVSILGESREKTILDFDSNTQLDSGGSGFSIERLTISGGNGNGALRIKSTNFQIRDVLFTGNGSINLFITGAASRGYVSDSIFTDKPVKLQGGKNTFTNNFFQNAPLQISTSSGDDNIISNNTLFDNGNTISITTPAEGNIIIGNVLGDDATTQDGRILVSGDRNIIIGNVFKRGRTGIEAIDITGDENIIENNQINGASSAYPDGIFVNGDKNIIKGNVIKNSSSNGINLASGAENNLVEGNYLIDNSGAGILVASGADNNVIHGNSYSNNTLDNVENLGTNNTFFYFDSINSRFGFNTTTPAYLFQIGSILNNTFFSVDNSGNATTSGNLAVGKKFSFSSITTKALDNAGITVTTTDSLIDISSSEDLLMTSIPHFSTSTDGTLLVLHNTGDFDIEFQDVSILSGSGLILKNADPTLEANSTLTLIYLDSANSGAGGWQVQSHPNTSASANILNVRNTSGSAIAAFKPVYNAGYNAGLKRTLIALADADDLTKMPAIGITAEAIGNNRNGEIITSGILSKIDTSSFSVGDNLYVDTTAGTLTATRPSVDAIQKMAEVLRSQSQNGVVLIQGAGRSNDVPWDAIFTTLQVTDTLTVENLVLVTGTTTNWTVLGNATTTGWFNVGNTDVVGTLGDLIGAGDLFVGGNATITNSFLVGTNNLFVNSSNGFVGIGTASPLSLFNVDFDASNAPAQSTLDHAIFLQSSANSGEGNFGAGIIFGQPNGGIVANRGASIFIVEEGSATKVGLSFNVHTAAGADPRFEAMRIDGSGNVGIGTTTPFVGFELAVDGDIFAENTIVSNSAITLQANNDTTDANDLILLFGGTNAEHLKWDGSDQGFVFTDDLRVFGKLNTSESAGIGISSGHDGTLHVHTASAGSVTAGSNADDFVIENSGQTGMSFLTPGGANDANIFFGEAADNNIGKIVYKFDDATGGAMIITTENTVALTIDGNQAVKIVGDLRVDGGNIGLTSDTDLIQMTANAIDLNGAVTINEDSANVDFRVESNANQYMLFVDGGSNSVGINRAAPSGAMIYIDQSNSSAAIPTVIIDQADISEGLINFIGSDRGAVTTATGGPSATVSVASIRVEISGVIYVIPLFADQ